MRLKYKILKQKLKPANT